MEDLCIRKVQKEEIPALAALAKEIWPEHFTPIIGADQTAYMIEKFQSAPAMRQQVENGGYRYYFLEYMGQRAGYTGIKSEDGALFLSKIYVKKEFRRHGIARRTFAFLEDLCQKESLSKIWLTVNRHNGGSVACYRELGFTVARTQVADIGNGFVMDDYIMEKAMEQTPRKLLFVNACVRPRGVSRTQRLADAFLEEYRALHPQDTIEELTLTQLAPRCLFGEEFALHEALKQQGKTDGPEFAPARQFAAADVIAVAAPMWELSFPALLKAYIENVSVPNVTFAAGENPTGCRGLCRAKSLAFLTTRGGEYPGEWAGMELGCTEWRALCRFFGIPRFLPVFAQGLDTLPPQQAEARLQQAILQARAAARD